MSDPLTYRQMDGQEPTTQAATALKHLLCRIRDDERVRELLGPGSQTFDLCTEAYASLIGTDLRDLRQLVGTGDRTSDLSESNDSTAYSAQLLTEARQIVVEHQRASISLVQRRLRIRYAAAAQLLEELEREGTVSVPNAAGCRTVLKS